MIRPLASHFKGGGGVQPTYASAGGVDGGGLETAIKVIFLFRLKKFTLAVF